ncbi:Multiple epidermal growth factor-like domains protein 8 [Nymphon striatum]|nr:Multiple epidermal growth factor-like domains protein 8 [Nymphon striatum]
MPGNRAKNQVDYILVNRHTNLTNVEVLNRVTGSDHRMVRATICINVKSDRTKLIMTRHIPVVATQDQIDQYRLELTNSLQVFAVVDEDIDQANSQLIKTMKDAAKKANPTCNQSLNKFSVTTLSLMNRRNDLIIRNSEDLLEKRDLNKTIHKRQRTETRAYNQRIVETTIKEGKGYKTAKKRLAIGNRQIASLKNADGEIVTDREEILRIGERFYQTLYTSSLNIHPTYSFSEDEEDPIPDITRIEVESAIKTLKSGKSAGEDGISSTLIKKGGSLMAIQLAQLFTNSNSSKQFITLKFLEMVTECSYDHLFIYDGDSYNDTLLGSFSGSTRPPLVTATSGFMLILLFSDTNYIRDGFVAEYYITDCQKNCSSHGKCVSHKCECDLLWAGPACDFHLCPNMCGEAEGRGICEKFSEVPHCICKSGYSGESCNLPPSNAGTYNLNYAFGDLVTFDFTNTKWHNLTNKQTGKIPSARYGHSMSEYAGNIVIFGGRDKTKHFNDIWLYNVAKNLWTKEAVASKFLPPPLAEHTLTLVDDNWLYVTGGQLSDGKFSSALYKINLNDGAQWIKVQILGGKEMNCRLVGHTTVFHPSSRSLIVYGGISADNARFSKLSNIIFAFHVDENFWTEIHSSKGSTMKSSIEEWIPMERAFHSANLVGDYMIVYGGYSHRHSHQEICYDDELYFYHLTCHRWVNYSLFRSAFPGNKASIPKGSFSHVSVVRNGTMLIISGGYSGNVRSALHAYMIPENIARVNDESASPCHFFKEHIGCKGNPECGWCRSSKKCLPRASQDCTDALNLGTCPGVCSVLHDCKSCLLFGRSQDTSKNISKKISNSSMKCSWCVQAAKCVPHNDKRPCWTSPAGITGWWGNITTDITQLGDCLLKDFRPGLTWLKYRNPMDESQPDEVSIIRKTAQIFSLAPAFATEVEYGGVFTSRFLGFIHPLGAIPQVDRSLNVFMGSSEADAALKMSLDDSEKLLQIVAYHSADVHYKRTTAHRPLEKASIFPNSSVGNKYLVDFIANQTIVTSTRAHINASMQLEWNGFRLYRDVFSVEFLEPFKAKNCENNTNCLQCLSNTLCGWNEDLQRCLPRLNSSLVNMNDHSLQEDPKSNALYLNTEFDQCNVCPDYIYCDDCLKGTNCEWLVESAICVRGGRYEFAVKDISNCPVFCNKRRSCTDCLSLPGRCAWCEQTQSCFIFSTYTTYFQYGACREWVDEDHVVLNRYANDSNIIAAKCQDCSLHKTCKSCLEDLSCGWCGNRRNPFHGVCVRGDFKHTYEGECASLVAEAHNISDAEPADWSYSICPDIDECGLGLHNCHSNATCINTFESYSCSCKRGFKGDGIVECERRCYENCLHGFCSEAPDYKCICELGWTGVACDIDCGCHNHSTCEVKVGHCDECLEWTEGASCEHCQVGSYGDATSETGCHKCQCNNHGNATAGICDSTTGICFCQDQTMGHSCEDCKPGFYGNPRNGGQCFRECESRAVVTSLESGGLGSNGENKAKSCLWILSVFDNFDTENLVISRKSRSVRSTESIRLTINGDINVPCDENGVYVYDGFPDFMINQSSHQRYMGKLLGRFCERSNLQDIIVEAMSGFMTVYYEQTYPSHGFNSTFSVLQCKNGCGSGKHKCIEDSCVCEKNRYGMNCDQVICPNNCHQTRDKMGRLLSFCNHELGRCVCKEGYGGNDCSIELKYGDIVWTTLFNPNTIQEDLIKPAKSLPRMGHSLHALADGHLLMFGGYSLTGGVRNDLFLLNIEKNSWHQISESGNKPRPRYFHGSAYVPSINKLYIYGGLDQNQVFNDFWMFDIDNLSWAPLQVDDNLPPLAGLTLTNVMDKKLILIGGFSPEYGFNAELHAYDLEKDIWSKMNVSGSSPIGIYGHTAVYHPRTNATYVYGGYIYEVDRTLVSNKLYAVIEDYNNTANWTLLPIEESVTSKNERPSARYFHTAITTANYMVIVGGSYTSELDTTIAYNYKCNMWIPLDQPDLRIVGTPISPTYGLDSAYVNNSMYIYGGINGVMHENLIELKLPEDICAIHSHSRFTCLKNMGCAYCSVFQKDGTNLTFCYDNDKNPPREFLFCFVHVQKLDLRSEDQPFAMTVFLIYAMIHLVHQIDLMVTAVVPNGLNDRSCYQYKSCSECLAHWPAHRNATKLCKWCSNCQSGKCIPAGNVCEEENNCNMLRVSKHLHQCPERICLASDCDKCGRLKECIWTRNALRSGELGRTVNKGPIFDWNCVRKYLKDASNFSIIAMPPQSCPPRCHQYDTCETCLSKSGGEGGWHSCSWSQTLGRCMSPSFQPLRCAFGECGVLLLGSRTEYGAQQCSSPCHQFQQSRTCLSNPTCGWCSLSGKAVDGRGLCMRGGLFGPTGGVCSHSSIKLTDGVPLNHNVSEWIKMSDGPPIWSYLKSPPENECLNGHHNCDNDREECIDTEQSFECRCRPGYLPSQEGTCKPVCNQGCVFGNCVQPDVCECHFGYIGINCTTQCLCNGQSNCAGPNQLDVCLACQNNTQGHNCEKCKPFFVGSPKKKIKCISCKVFCNGHSEICLSPEFYNSSSVLMSSIHLQPQMYQNIFDIIDIRKLVVEGPESEAVCMNCQQNTEGDRCEQCKSGFFRIGDSTRDGCRPCQCHGHSNICDPRNGENCNCQNHTESDPQCNPKTSKNSVQPCWKLQCSKCKEYFLGTPTNGHQCYRHMFVEKDYCFDPHTQDECAMKPNPLSQRRTVFFAVQPKYMNVDIRIVVDVSAGGVDFYFSAKEDTFVVKVNKTTGIHYVTIDDKYGLKLSDDDGVTNSNSFNKGIKLESSKSKFTVKRSLTEVLENRMMVNVTERYSAHKLKKIHASPSELIKFVRINDPHEFIVIKNLKNRLVITVPLEIHDLRSTRFYMVLHGIGSDSQNLTFGNMFFRQDQPRIDLFVFFSVFFSCFFLFLSICVIIWKVKQVFEHRQEQQRHAEEMKHMASRPFAKILVIVDESNFDDVDFMVPPSMYSSPSHPSNHHHKKSRNKHLVYTQVTRDFVPKIPLLTIEEKHGVRAISVEPTSDNLAAVSTVLMQLPGGTCAPVRLTLASTLAAIRSFPPGYGNGNGLRTYIRRRTSHINV